VTFRKESLMHLGWSGDVVAEAEVDAGHSAGQQWMILHTHTRAGMMWQGQKEVDHPSMGSGWHA